MLLRPLRWAFSALTTLVGLYVFFFVPIERQTLYEHARNIASTHEAQALRSDLTRASLRVADKLRDEARRTLLPGIELENDSGAPADARAP